MHRTDFQFDLPADLIAQKPALHRSASRLLSLDSHSGKLDDYFFTDLLALLHPNDCLVFNNTKVMPARLLGRKDSGGKAEILVERVLDDYHALAHIGSNKPVNIGQRMHMENSIDIEVIGHQDGLFELYFHGKLPVIEVLQQYGRLPLPPYIKRDVSTDDAKRYQTVYAKHFGAVAAPTAGLHFDKAMLDKIDELGTHTAYITLHVGAGTFQPVRTNDITKHTMHAERVEVSSLVCDKINAARARGGRVIAVGTTSVRALESASLTGNIAPFSGETDIFIYPGYCFNSVDAMITNFHLPESTLIMLVAAFAGRDNIMAAYQHAIEQQYRFFSYGDAMFIHKKTI